MVTNDEWDNQQLTIAVLVVSQLTSQICLQTPSNVTRHLKLPYKDGIWQLILWFLQVINGITYKQAE